MAQTVPAKRPADDSKISHAHNYTRILRNASDGKCWEPKRVPWFPQTFTDHLLRAKLSVRAWGYTDTQGTATALTGLTVQRGRRHRRQTMTVQHSQCHNQKPAEAAWRPEEADKLPRGDRAGRGRLQR